MIVRRGFCNVAVSAVLIAAFPVAALAGGTIKGKITFKGEKPKRLRIDTKMKADAFCAKANPKPVGEDELIIVNKNGTVRNVIVFVKDGLGDATFESPTDKVTIDQKGCMYKPHVLTIQVGQPLEVLNSDMTLHNIHGLPLKNAEFNFGQPRAGMKKELSFKREEFFKVKCDVHPWMSAFVGVFAHPFHTTTGREGAFELKDLPAGEYTIGGWHEKKGEFATAKVKVGDGETKEIELVLEEK